MKYSRKWEKIMTIRTSFFVILTFVITIILIVPVLVMQIDNSSSICGLSTANAQDNPCLSQDATISAMQVQLMQATIDGMNYEATITVYESESENKRQPVTNNSDWTPVIRNFDAVEMVLVPAGCFDMGSDEYSDEQPIHTQCIDEPFWIDRYEVTNEQFGSAGSAVCEYYSSESNQPRNCVSWFDARDYCESLGGRLPTEVEWEYAARGPDNLIYPWGDTYNADYVIGEDDPTYGDTRTAPVGSRAGGISWVGAYDMSGNLWEWVSSWLVDYPYNDNDGRENDSGYTYRVLRGGSFNFKGDILRAADRGGDDPGGWTIGFGFRCARSY
jgi:formylglycine-generating enzyme required for sulfatase activity